MVGLHLYIIPVMTISLLVGSGPTTASRIPPTRPSLPGPPEGGAFVRQGVRAALQQQLGSGSNHTAPPDGPRRGALAILPREAQEEAGQEALASLLATIVTEDLRQCGLTVTFDEGFENSPAVRRLLQQPNVRQVVGVRGWEDLLGVAWEGPGCQAYVFLLRHFTSLLTFANMGEDPWDFSGRYVTVGLSRQQLQQLTSSRKGRKTEHLVGLVQTGGAGEWAVLVNQLYGGAGLRLVTTWRGTTFTTLHHLLFPDKLADLQGAALKVVTFQFAPHMMEGRSGGLEGRRRYGRDLQLVRALARVLNFTLSFQQPPGGELWGKKLANGSWTGLVGSLARDEAHMGVANIFLSNNNNRLLVQEFSRLYDSDVSCFLARREPPLARWHSLALPFTLQTWLAILAGLALTSTALTCIASASGGEIGTLRGATWSTLYTWGVHLRVAQGSLPRGTATQVLVLVMWVYAILLTTGYSCNLTAYLTVVRAPTFMDTFRQLHASSHSVLGIGPFFKVSMASSTNSYLKELTERYVSHPNFQEAVGPVHDGTAVFIESRKFLEYLMNTQVKSHGTPTMRIMKECFAPYSIAVALQKHSPLKRKLDQVIGWVFESGLVRRWFLDSLTLTRQLEVKKTGSEGDSGNEGERQVVPLTIGHLQGIFLVLIFGHLLSSLVLLTELAC